MTETIKPLYTKHKETMPVSGLYKVTATVWNVREDGVIIAEFSHRERGEADADLFIAAKQEAAAARTA